MARATTIKSACLVVPPLLRADSGTNLVKRGGQMMTSWQSARTRSERRLVRIPVGPQLFSPL